MDIKEEKKNNLGRKLFLVFNLIFNSLFIISCGVGYMEYFPNRNPDSVGGGTDNGSVPNPVYDCGVTVDCYTYAANKGLTAGATAIIPSGEIEFVDNSNRGGSLVWVEKSGNRVLQVSGYDGWQKNLNRNGKSFSSVDFNLKNPNCR